MSKPKLSRKQIVLNWAEYFNKSNTDPLEWLITKPRSIYNQYIYEALESELIGKEMQENEQEENQENKQEENLCPSCSQILRFNHLGSIFCVNNH